MLTTVLKPTLEAIVKMPSPKKSLICVLLVFLTFGCGFEGRLKNDADRLGDLDIKLDGSTFGYLKGRLSALALQVGDCFGEARTILVDCQEAEWGSAAFVKARFVTGQSKGLMGSANRLTDNDLSHDVKINEHFAGTLCGERMEKVIESKTACGRTVSITNPGTGRHDIAW